MKISTKGVYALEAMIELAAKEDEHCVSIRELAKCRKCSVKYLEQIFKQLKIHKLVISTRGKDGGYRLARSADKITAKEIVLAVEEKLDPVTCLSVACPRSRTCHTRQVWQGMQYEIYKVLDSKTLANLVALYIQEVNL